MTAPTLAIWTCRAEVAAMEDAELADALRRMAADEPRRPIAHLLVGAADRLNRPPSWCPICEEGGS